MHALKRAELNCIGLRNAKECCIKNLRECCSELVLLEETGRLTSKSRIRELEGYLTSFNTMNSLRLAKQIIFDEAVRRISQGKVK